MEKVKLIAFGPLAENEVKYLQIGEATIAVQQKLPYETILEMIQWSINYIMDDRGFVSEPISRIIQEIAVLKYFTNLDLDNIDLADFTQGDLYEYYDFISAFDVFNKVVNIIDDAQIEFYQDTVKRTLESLLAYRNSAAGIIEMLQIQSENSTDSLKKSLDILGDEVQFDKVIQMLQLVNPTTAPILTEIK